MTGVYRRCECIDPVTGRQLGGRCPGWRAAVTGAGTRGPRRVLFCHHAEPDPGHAAGGAERGDAPRPNRRERRQPCRAARARRPRAVVWTPERGGHWRATGERRPHQASLNTGWQPRPHAPPGEPGPIPGAGGANRTCTSGRQSPAGRQRYPQPLTRQSARKGPPGSYARRIPRPDRIPRPHPGLSPAPSKISGQAGARRKARSVRVRRQGLEPRTRGLRVRCSVRFPVATSCDFMVMPAEIRCYEPCPGASSYRSLPGWNATAEQTWSKHGGRLISGGSVLSVTAAPPDR